MALATKFPWSSDFQVDSALRVEASSPGGDAWLSGPVGSPLPDPIAQHTYTGGPGNDTFTGTSGADAFVMNDGGDDNVSGLKGQDNFDFGGSLTAADHIDGGQSEDYLHIFGNYTLTFAPTTMVNVENIFLGAGYHYDLTTDNATVAAGSYLNILWETAPGAGDSLTFDGHSETDGRFQITGTPGDDTLTGGGKEDVIYAGGDGTDKIYGGGSDDYIDFQNSLGAGDVIDGGDGHDTVTLDGGNADLNVTFAPATMVDVEQVFVGDSAGKFCVLTMDNATVAAGKTLTVTLNADSMAHLYFYGGAETDGTYVVQGGAGSDQIFTGHGADTIDTGGGDDVVNVLNPDAHVNGGDNGINGDEINLDGTDTTHWLMNEDVVGFEKMSFINGAAFTVVMNDANVAAGATLTVSGNGLYGGTTSLNFDGSAEMDGHYTLIGASGDDVLTGGAQSDYLSGFEGGNDKMNGGAGNDQIYMGSALTAADRINGGGGNDVVYLDGDYSHGVKLAGATFTNVEAIEVFYGNSYNITVANGTVTPGQLMTIEGMELTAGETLTFDGTKETGGEFVIEAGAGNDVLTGGQDYNIFDGGLGADTMTGGAKIDTFEYTDAVASTGSGFDTIKSFDGSMDRIDINGTLGGIDPEVTSGRLRDNHFDSDLSSALAHHHLKAGDAVLFTPTSGNEAGKTFLIVDLNGTAGYQSGEDVVIRLENAVHLTDLSAANFV